jgi:ribonuclease Z
MSFSITILGSGSATPAPGRYPTSQLLTYQNDCFLIDCGEGTQYRLLELKFRPSHLKAIFISHLHGDHYFGLAPLLSSLNLGRRTDDLYLFGPKGLDVILDVIFKHSEKPYNFPLRFVETDTQNQVQIFENKYFTVQTIPLDHKIDCAGFLFREKNRKRRIRKESLRTNISVAQIKQLKDGLDVVDEDGNLLYLNEQYTLPAQANRSYAFCSDTRFDERTADYVRGVDVLYHEATFLEELSVQASERYHSTPRQAAMTAQKAGVGTLLIGHFSSRYKTFELFLAEAQAVFPNTKIAAEGMTFEIEFYLVE